MRHIQKNYFLDSNIYSIGLQNTLNSQEEHLNFLKDQTFILQEDHETVSAFTFYGPDWEKAILSNMGKIKENISKQQEIVTRLQEKQIGIKAKISEKQSEAKSVNANLINIRSQLSEFDKLLKKSEEENKLSGEYELAEKKLRALMDKQTETKNQKDTLQKRISEISDKLNELNRKKQALNDGLSKVSFFKMRKYTVELDAPLKSRLVVSADNGIKDTTPLQRKYTY